MKRTAKGARKKKSNGAKAKGQPARRPAQGEMKHRSWDSVEREELNPLLARQMITGKDVMVARMTLKKGCVVPMHHHHNEQVSCILEGALKFVIDSREIVVSGGEVLAIPPNMPHAAEALADTLAIDVFNPPRMDWIQKKDQYLRGK